jgi:hypothetical protein
MTRVAQTYPHKMCVTIADMLARTIWYWLREIWRWMVSKCDTFHPHFVLFSFDLVRTLRFVQEEVRKAGMGRERDIYMVLSGARW